jgi:hypothetical protein
MNRFVPIVVASALALPATASAQEQVWLQDRRFREGIGYRVGDFELHPGVGAEFGYDSNFLRRGPGDRSPDTAFPDTGKPQDILDVLRLSVTPSLSLSTLGPQRRGAGPEAPPPDFEFRTDLSLTYNEFIPLSGSDAEQTAIQDQRDVSGNLGLRLGINPRRVWSANLFGDLGRTIDPSNEAVSELTFDRLSTRAGGDVVFTPGAGLLDWRLGYAFSGMFFEDFSSLTQLNHTISTRGRWRFLPRTAVIYDAKLDFLSFPNASSDAKDKVSSMPVRTRLGLNGLITPSFAVLVMGGWGASFYSAPNGGGGVQDFDSVIGQLELKWFFEPTKSNDPQAASNRSALSVGFDRDFVDSYIGSFYAQNRGYANASMFVSRRVLLSVEGGVSANAYPEIPAYSSAAFTDVRIDATLFGEYRLRDWLGLNTTLRYGQNVSGAEFTTKIDGATEAGPTTFTKVEDLAWSQFEAYLGVRWLM